MDKKIWMMGLWALCLSVSSCSGDKETAEKAPINVKTELMAPGNGSARQPYVGIVEEREATAVSFTSMGLVKRVLVSEGQAVSRGQLIAEMDDTQARNLLAVAESQMNQANDALQRYKMLHDSGSLPEIQWVEIESKVQQAQSQLEVARKNMNDCQLKAPVSGIIGRKMVGAGETAMPSQAVVTILDISEVKVKVSVPESEVNGISSNTPTTITVGAAGKQVNGGRIEKGVQADALTHTYDVRIHVSNADRKLLPGMVANVQFDGASADAQTQLTVPVTSVQRRADGTLFVWTIGADSKAHRTTVGIGQTQGNRVVLTSGISQGDRVVTEGYQKLGEGTNVAY